MVHTGRGTQFYESSRTFRTGVRCFSIRLRSGIAKGNRPLPGFGVPPIGADFRLRKRGSKGQPPLCGGSGREVWGTSWDRKTFFLPFCRHRRQGKGSAEALFAKVRAYGRTPQAPPGGCRSLNHCFCELLFQKFGMTHVTIKEGTQHGTMGIQGCLYRL